jgi:amidase
LVAPSSQVEICFTDAVELVRLIHARKLSAVEVMAACLEQIARINPKVNAICTLVDEDDLLRHAQIADERVRRSETLGPLHGLPHVVKDLVPTAGIRTTYGSPIYQDNVPLEDALLVERLKAAGAIVIGKTNTPEFGAGSQTFNPLFGFTRNPYDLTKTCGGSSGGAAVSVACGMTPLADGSDLGGSLRNPPSFCGVVGFRPSIGRVPVWRPQPRISSTSQDSQILRFSNPQILTSSNPHSPTSSHSRILTFSNPQILKFDLSVDGPIGRSVRDVALLLSVLAGPDARDPTAIDEPGSLFRGPLGRDFTGVRIAWSRNLGRYPVEPVVNEVCDNARHVFSDLGGIVEDDEPDLADADEAFQTLRAWTFARDRGEDYRQHRDLMKDTVVWNIEQGLKLTAADIVRAETQRAALCRRVRQFLERYEFLVLPVSQVAPFPVEVEWVREINGTAMNTYIDWMGTCYAITLTGLPALAVPCGFTSSGLPIGLQIVGRHQRDLDVLKLGHAFEQATQIAKKRRPSPGG